MSAPPNATGSDPATLFTAIKGTWRYPSAEEPAGWDFVHFTFSAMMLQFIFVPHSDKRIPVILPYSINADEMQIWLKHQEEPQRYHLLLQDSTLTLTSSARTFICTRPTPDEVPAWFQERLSTALSRLASISALQNRILCCETLSSEDCALAARLLDASAPSAKAVGCHWALSHPTSDDLKQKAIGLLDTLCSRSNDPATGIYLLLVVTCVPRMTAYANIRNFCYAAARSERSFMRINATHALSDLRQEGDDEAIRLLESLTRDGDDSVANNARIMLTKTTKHHLQFVNCRRTKDLLPPPPADPS